MSRMWIRKSNSVPYAQESISQVIRNIMPGAASFVKTLNTPFVVYNEAFGDAIGRTPRLELAITDDRAPYFYSGGAFIPRIGTLFLTSNLLRDPEPSAVPSANKRTEITKIDFYSSRNYNRDKVRFHEHSYMAAGVAGYPNGDGNGVILCVQGSLKEPAGLVHIDTKRPHKSRMLINNFQGRPFNSPCDIVANPMDGSVYFTDPAYGYERGYRPKPQLPTGHIYRYEPESGECRVVANGHSRPAGLALSPDFTTLYVSELGDKYGGTTIFAYSIATSDPFKEADTSFQISVTQNPNSTNNIHKSTPSNSTSGSNSGSNNSQTGIKPSVPPNSFNRTQPLTPRMSPINGIMNEVRSRSHSRGPAEPAPQTKGHIVNHPNSSRSTTQLPVRGRPPPPPQRMAPFLTNKRLFAYTPTYSPAALISTSPGFGHLFLGTEEGVEVFSSFSGDLIGKILVDEDEGLPFNADSTPSAPPPTPRTPNPSQSNVHPALRSPGLERTSSPTTPRGLAGLSGLVGLHANNSYNNGSSNNNNNRDGPSDKHGRSGNAGGGGDDDDDDAIANREAEQKKKKRRKFQKGVSKVAFGLNGEFWLLGGERLWKGTLDVGASEYGSFPGMMSWN